MSVISCTQLAILSSTVVAAAAAADEPAVRTGVANSPIATSLLAIAVTLIVALVFRSALLKPFRSLSNNLAGQRLRVKLRRHSDRVLRDFLLPGAYGGLTRIDYAVMLPEGLVCIQTKYCDGAIVGAADEPQWSYTLGKDRRNFLNPLIQNQGRTKAVQNVVPRVPVASVVIFCGDVELVSQPATNVLRACQLDQYLAGLSFGKALPEDRDAAWDALTAAALTDKDSRKDFDAQLSFS